MANVELGGDDMTAVQSLQFELRGRFDAISDVSKSHLSVRWESAARIVRVGACIFPYSWATRLVALESLLVFERDHADEFAVEFDIIPLASVNDPEFAEA